MTDRTHRQLDDGKPAVGTETGGQRELLRKRERKPRAGRQWETDDAHRKLDKPVQRLFGRRPPKRGRQGLKIRGFKRRLAAPAQARTAGIGNTWIQAPIGGARPGADGRLPCAVPFRNGRNLSGFRVLPLYLRAGFAQNCERNAPTNCNPHVRCLCMPVLPKSASEMHRPIADPRVRCRCVSVLSKIAGESPEQGPGPASPVSLFRCFRKIAGLCLWAIVTLTGRGGGSSFGQNGCLWGIFPSFFSPAASASRFCPF